MTVVVDASTVVAALVDTGAVGQWAEDVVASGPLLAPHLMQVEVVSILRRSVLTGDVTADVAALAHQDLLQLRVELYPYRPFADRVWELRSNVSPYDAWYVALAESVDAELATVDGRLARASGPRCRFVLPPR